VVEGKDISNETVIRALEFVQAKEPSHRYNGALVNWYEGGEEGMGAHADDEADLVKGAPIYSISLGTGRVFRVHPGKETSPTLTSTLTLTSNLNQTQI